MSEKFILLYTGNDGNLKCRILTEEFLFEETPINGPDGTGIPCQESNKIEISVVTDEENPYPTRAIVTVIFLDENKSIDMNEYFNWGPKIRKQFYDNELAVVKFMKHTNTLKTEEEALKELNQSQ